MNRRAHCRAAVGDRRAADHLPLVDAVADRDLRLARGADMLLELDANLLGRQQFGLERPDVAELPQPEFLDQPRHRRLAVPHVRFRPRCVERRVLPTLLLRGQPPLVLGADLLGIEVLRARIEAAQVALAAEAGADRVRLAHHVEAQASHRPVRLDGMPQEPARTKLGAIAALVARALADAGDLLPSLLAAADDDMVVGQDDDAAGGLIDQGIVIGLEGAHHHAADHVVRVGNGRPAGRLHALGERDADRHAERDRFGHRAGDGEKLLGHRLAGRGGHVDGRFHVHHHGVNRQRDAARRNDAAQGVVDQDELVAGRIGIAQAGRRPCLAAAVRGADRSRPGIFP